MDTTTPIHPLPASASLLEPKMQSFYGVSSARQLRMGRIFRNNPQRTLIVPLDHPLTDGPFPRGGRYLNQLVGKLATNGADAVVMHKGNVRFVDPVWFKQLSLIVHLSASTIHAPDPNDKVLVGTVEESLALGADAVSVHVNIGSPQEARQIADMATVAAACDRWNVPLLAMMYPRGPKISNSKDLALIAHAVTVAAEVGADLVKTYFPGSVQKMKNLASVSSVPILVAGGARSDTENELLDFVDAAMQGGAAGLAMGRNIVTAEDPGAVTRLLAGRVHEGLLPPAPAEMMHL